MSGWIRRFQSDATAKSKQVVVECWGGLRVNGEGKSNQGPCSVRDGREL